MSWLPNDETSAYSDLKRTENIYHSTLRRKEIGFQDWSVLKSIGEICQSNEDGIVTKRHHEPASAHILPKKFPQHERSKWQQAMTLFGAKVVVCHKGDNYQTTTTMKSIFEVGSYVLLKDKTKVSLSFFFSYKYFISFKRSTFEYIQNICAYIYMYMYI
ncbi:hypothetical protein RFI_26526 [Reticulomyxa filosa]|uniref:Uncharacterized protein n=1 Tax=Reticulomyxa filosa TaxID=46433 RepID=X6MB32_RETFI|nr:hypothetical protein RFI_26526 [Reticulomyxa filosa]|eukprot:ETO10851.1 hypothetical protein RFI_26526 [Reticulomyxa filosa]